MADNPIKYSEFIQPDNSVTELIAQLEQLNITYSETLKGIRSDATKAKEGLTEVSGATAKNRDVIKEAAIQADKLAKAEKDVAFAESENAKQLALLKKQQTDINNINKLTIRLNNAAEGSYDKLSAQYSINKIKLNAMSGEERAATEAGRKLETETNAIYQEMKRLQEATGKTTLNVGNYEAATMSLRAEIRRNTAELARLKLAGQDSTQGYQELLSKTGEMKDAMNDASKEIKNMASDTSDLDSILSTAGAAAGGFSVYTGAMEMFGASSEETAEAQKKLQSAIAITTGIQAVQNAVQKDSAMMMGIAKIQSAALAKSEAYRRLIAIQGTSATIGATVAQRAFNLVAMANPYVILAVALVTVVGALILFANNTEVASEKQKMLNDTQKGYLELLQLESDKMNSVGVERVKALEKELALAKSRNASNAELSKIEEDLADEKRKNHNLLTGYYGKELEDLDKNKEKLLEYKKELIRLQGLKAMGESKVKVDFELNGNITKAKVDDAIEIIQGKVDNFNKTVEIATTLKTEGIELDVAEAERKAKLIQDAKDQAKTELELNRKAEDAKINLIQNSGEQQRAQIRANYTRQIADLKFQLDNEKNLTTKGREAINNTMTYLTKKMGLDLIEVNIKTLADQRAMTRASQDIEIELMKEGGDKRRAQLNIEYSRQIEDLQIKLATDKDLTLTQKSDLADDILNLQKQQGVALSNLNTDLNIEQLNREKDAIEMRLATVREGSDAAISLRIQSMQKQRTIELAQNARLAEDVRQKESDINAKWDAAILKESSDLTQTKAMLIFDQQQALDQSEFDLIRNSEDRKTRFKLNAEKERLKKILELNKTAAVKMTDVEVQTIQNTIAKIDKEITKSKSDEKGKDIYGLFGLNLDDGQKEAINESVSYALEAVNSFAEAKVKAAEAAVTAADKEVDSNEKRLQSELDARANGYASSVSTAQKELALAKKNQAEAIKEQQKAQKAQAAIQSVQQMGSLVTASAMIWGQLGFPWAIPALAVMWGSFAYSKLKASEVTKQQDAVTYGEGGFEILSGGSHASGNDIPIGTTKSGRPRKAEGGEAMAIINKRNTSKYKNILPNLINKLNNGTFEENYSTSFLNTFEQNKEFSVIDLSGLESSVNDIRDQGKRKTYRDVDGNEVVIYKNLKRIILSNN